MLTWIREKFGTLMVGGIIGFIAFVFVFYGVFSPKSTRGLHEGSVAGTVNGERITIPEFNRELNRRVEMFKSFGGGTLTEEQMKAYHLRESVFTDLATRKALGQEAIRQGLIPSDDEIRDKIREIPSFQKDGKFNYPTYKQTLEANQYTPGSFEKLVRDDLAQQRWQQHFVGRAHVSEEEAKREFLFSHNKRNIKYVMLTPEAVKPSVKATDQAAAPATEKPEETQKRLESLSEQVVAKLTESKNSDKQVEALLKSYGIKVKSTGLKTRQGLYFPEFGQASELTPEFVKDAFAEPSPLDARAGGKAKKYPLAGRILVALVTETEKPQLEKYPSEREKIQGQLVSKKAQSIYQEWVKGLMEKAKIDQNPAVLADRE